MFIPSTPGSRLVFYIAEHLVAVLNILGSSPKSEKDRLF